MGLFNNFKRSAKKVQNQDLLEAIVAACMLIAASDGTIEKAEQEKTAKLLANNDNLSAFPATEISRLTKKFGDLLDADFQVGKLKMMKEIREVASNPEQAEEIFANAVAVAKSDGEIEDTETKVLVSLANELGVDLAEYGIAA